MNSRPLYGMASAIAFALLTSSCTERLAVEPITTTADDWTPRIQLQWAGYQRVRIAVDGPPRKELLRNIERYVLEATPPSVTWVYTADDSLFAPIDTASATQFDPSYYSNYYSETTWDSWQSEPKLPYGSRYEIRLAVHYRTGTVRRSSAINVGLDPGRGIILARNSIPSPTTPPRYFYFDRNIALWNDKILVTNSEQLYAIDTASGTSMYLLDLFPAVYDTLTGFIDQNKYRVLSIGMDADTLCAVVMHNWDNRIQLFKTSLNTGIRDSSVFIAPDSAWSTVRASVYQNRLAVLQSSNAGRFRISMFDGRSGVLLQQYPSGYLSSEILSQFCFDGTDFWIADGIMYTQAPFHAFRKLNPANLASIETHRNPIYNFGAIAWNPPYVWVEDRETATIAKVLLDGY